MRTFARIAGGAAAAALVLLIAPVPASAGGPTSVLLVSPARQATASLYTTDEAYQRLLTLLGESPVGDATAPDLKGGPGSDAINVTWLVHDVQIWRVDRIFTEAEGGPWVETVMVAEGGSAWEKPGTLHRPADGKELIGMLTALKLLGSTPPVEAYQGPKAAEPQQASTPVATVATTRDVAELNWLWLVIGTAAGATLAIGFRPLVRRLRPH